MMVIILMAMVEMEVMIFVMVTISTIGSGVPNGWGQQ